VGLRNHILGLARWTNTNLNPLDPPMTRDLFSGGGACANCWPVVRYRIMEKCDVRLCQVNGLLFSHRCLYVDWCVWAKEPCVRWDPYLLLTHGIFDWGQSE